MSGVLRKVLPYLRPYLWTFTFCLLLVLALTAVELVKPWPLLIVVDNVLGGKPLTVPLLAGLPPEVLLAVACVGIVAVQAVVGLGSMWSNHVSINLGHRMVTDLRDDLYGHLQRLSLVFHSRQRIGDLMYRITADTFAEIMSDLLALELMDLEVERLYPSMRNTIEFWAILRKK